jgi:hypothetical protein
MKRLLPHGLRWLVILALLPCAGCVPTVVWLPDSSGFVYMVTDWPGDADEEEAPPDWLVHYDVRTKTRRTIAKTGTNTIAPALSPDGKRLAVAKLTMEEGKPVTLQVIVYDLQGKELRRTQAFRWSDKGPGPASFDVFPQVYWAPQGNKLLVYAFEETGICDLDQDRMKKIEGVGIIICGTSPIRPDGKGFLFARDQPLPAFVDWDGNHADMELPEGSGAFRFPHLAAMYWTRWEGNVAVAVCRQGELRIDTATKTITIRPVTEALWALDGKDIQNQHTFPDGRTRIAVVFLTEHRGISSGGLPPSVRVDLIGPAAGQRRILVAATPHCGIYPSPNKELVVLRYGIEDKEKEKYQDKMMLVNAKGEVVAEWDTRK